MSASGVRVPDPTRTAPEPARRPRPGRHLKPVTRQTQRSSPAVPVLVGAGIVIVALFGLAVMHALLIGGQLRLDGIQREVASETEEIRRLHLRVAELESPDRVLDVARARLGMVQAAEIGYLLPASVETGVEERTRVEAAVRSEPEPVEVEATDSAPADEGGPDAVDGAGQDGDIDGTSDGAVDGGLAAPAGGDDE